MSGERRGETLAPVRYDVLPEASAVLIQARSNAGGIDLATTSITGEASANVHDDGLDLDVAPTARITLPVNSLVSGNPRYDAEIHRRLDADRYPTIDATLSTARLVGSSDLSLTGNLTIHGRTRAMSGSAEIVELTELRLCIIGEQLIDVRDFSISVPTALMLRIYPDVVVRFRIEAQRAGEGD